MFWTPFNIDYTNGKDANETVSTAIAKIEIQAQTVPTVINGIATLTGVIVGFSGAILGILVRDFLQSDKKAKEAMIGSFGLAVGGQDFLKIAWGYAFDGLITSLFQLLFVFLFFAYIMENPQPEKTQTQQPVPIEKRKEDNKNDAKDVERNPDAWTFFMGAIVGVVGSFLVTSIFEFAKLTLPNGVGYAIFYWGLIFLISSTVFFWLIKKTLVRIGINVSSRPFIVVSTICILLGIFMITLGILQIFNIVVIVK